MPNIDISRDATDLRKHYDRVQMQQGRVLTDDDFNEAERLDAEESRRIRADVIGPAGSPDNGFALKIVGTDLKLSAGTFYVGGLRLELEADESFNLQKDWLEQGSAPNETLTAPAGDQLDFVWMEVWQQPATSIEDKECLEASLGGGDTSAHIRTMRRARVLRNVPDANCASAWAKLLAAIAPLGVTKDFELITDATLKVEPDGTKGTDDLCSPPVNGGYLGAENQAIRVQITGPNLFTWGFDNGAPLYRVKLLADDAGALRKIHMLTVPKDQAHFPLEGQVIELLPWSALLWNGQKNAELSGFLATVDGGYNPDNQNLHISADPGNDTGTPVKPFGMRWKERSDKAAIANEKPPEDEYFYMRVWNRGADMSSAPSINFVPGTPVPLAKTGLQVTFKGTNLRTNDFWIIAVRPETPKTFVPWELFTGRAPHGVHRWIAPLGLIHWAGGGATFEVIDDCRPTFLPLTQIKGCCTYTVGDGTHSYGNFTKIQDAVKALPASGGRVCVLPGIYDESVLIDLRVAVTIHGCGSRSRVRAGVDINGDPLPAFMISNSTGIVIEDLAIESGPRSAVHITNARHVTVRHCLIQMRDVSTLWQAIFSRADDVLIDSNIIEVLPREGGPPAPKVPPKIGTPGAPAGVNTPPDPINIGFATRGGIQLGGGSDRVRIVRNIIRGGIWNGVTLGSIDIVGANDPNDNPDKPGSKDPCDPCRPVDLGDDPGPNDTRIESAGDLYDIEISFNRITDMGINGIGVVRFFNLAKGGDMVGVHGLHIVGNFITRCMRRDIAQIPPALQFLVGYGGIALAKVSDLRILRNEIINNGTSHIQPICGVFAIIVEGLQLDDNRIINNGPRTEAPVKNVQNGNRGGVLIWIVLPAIEPTYMATSLTYVAKTQRENAIPACSMRDNLIAAPVGRAVTFFALGYVVVNRNRLETEGSTLRGLDLIAATVLIGNFGLSNELTLGLLYMVLLATVGKMGAGGKDNMCQFAKAGGLINPGPPASFWPPFVRAWATGKTMLCENQITLNLTDEPFGFGLCSVVVFSLDDIGFDDNQCEVTTTNVFFFTDVLLSAGSVRLADNRLAETWMHEAFSGITIGGMNTTTDNQTTHCLSATSFLNLLMFKDNLALINAFCPQECGGM